MMRRHDLWSGQGKAYSDWLHAKKPNPWRQAMIWGALWAAIGFVCFALG